MQSKASLADPRTSASIHSGQIGSGLLLKEKSAEDLKAFVEQQQQFRDTHTSRTAGGGTGPFGKRTHKVLNRQGNAESQPAHKFSQIIDEQTDNTNSI